MNSITRIIAFVFVILGVTAVNAQRQMEYLDRGVIAIKQTEHKVFISWRLLGTEPSDLAFNLYRTTAGKTIKLNSEPLSKGTNFVDETVDASVANSYVVKKIVNEKEVESSKPFLLKTDALPYLSIPLRTPQGYSPNDVSVGDLDGDGEYELIVHQTGRGKDNSQAGYTDPPIFQAYKLDGTFLWEINLGKNIREGAHYTQFMVYDLDGDGKAEIAMKTGDGSVDGIGKVIGDSTKDYRNSEGRIVTGPEYFTIFNGQTGAAMATTNYLPGRGDIGAWGGIGGNAGNDNNGNRADRFLACIAYLDGVHPSVVMTRGYYGRTVLAAWDWRDHKLTSRWVFDSKDGKNPYSGMGNHNLSVTDVDGDGKDEIIFASMCVNSDGTGRYTTGLRHGDALHVGKLDPDRAGLQVFGIHEMANNTKGWGAALYDASTGEILYKGEQDKDVGRGVAENIFPGHKGTQMWWNTSPDLHDIKGNVIGPRPSSINFLIWWDGDFTRQLLDGNHIDKYGQGRLFTAEGCASNNGTKSDPALSADILGDWREEVIFRSADNKELRIFSTTIPTDNRLYTLMHNPQYRLSVAWQNVAYNQPPHTDYYLGWGMQQPPKPNIFILQPKK